MTTNDIARELADYIVTDHGSLWLLRPTTDNARHHLEAHVGDEAQWFAGALVVEPRYIVDLSEQLWADGFTVTEGY
jgi:hypothetical protein